MTSKLIFNFVDESAIIMVNKGALEAFTICLKRSRDIKTVANISEALFNLAAHGTKKKKNTLY